MFINYGTKASNTFSGVVMLVYYLSVSDRAKCKKIQGRGDFTKADYPETPWHRYVISRGRPVYLPVDVELPLTRQPLLRYDAWRHCPMLTMRSDAIAPLIRRVTPPSLFSDDEITFVPTHGASVPCWLWLWEATPLLHWSDAWRHRPCSPMTR